jgi:nicotinamide-nucleotide amidase
MIDLDTDDLPSIVRLLDERRWTMAVAESVTGGLVALRMTRTPESGAVFAGGIVTYHNAAKHDLLHVPPGPVVSAACALAMARNVARLFDAEVAVSTTGVAGPATIEGQPVGTVWTGVHVAGRTDAALHHLPSPDPDAVRDAATTAAFALLGSILKGELARPR